MLHSEKEKLALHGLFLATLLHLIGHIDHYAPSELKQISAKIGRPCFNIFWGMEPYTNWQYILVFVILIAVIVWVIYKLCKKKDSGGACCGCSLANTCKPEKKQRFNKKKEADSCSDKKETY